MPWFICRQEALPGDPELWRQFCEVSVLALALVKERVAGTKCLHVFRVVPRAGFVVPQDSEERLRIGFVDIDGVVVPGAVGKGCRFGVSYTGDFEFIMDVADRTGHAPAWHGDVISVNQEWARLRGVTVLE